MVATVQISPTEGAADLDDDIVRTTEDVGGGEPQHRPPGGDQPVLPAQVVDEHVSPAVEVRRRTRRGPVAPARRGRRGRGRHQRRPGRRTAAPARGGRPRGGASAAPTPSVTRHAGRRPGAPLAPARNRGRSDGGPGAPRGLHGCTSVRGADRRRPGAQPFPTPQRGRATSAPVWSREPRPGWSRRRSPTARGGRPGRGVLVRTSPWRRSGGRAGPPAAAGSPRPTGQRRLRG